MAAHDMTLATVTCTHCRHSYSDAALFCPNCGTAKVRAEGDSLLGKVLGERFLVQERIGQGTSGAIYRGEHVTLRRKVAIKVLHAELARDDLAVERFRREATMVAEVDNEHIVEIHDFGRTPDGRLYLAMELLEGETLDAVLEREGKLSVERTADILIQLGEALMEAHAVGYVHRDLRPRNVFLSLRRGKANFVKLLDFGLSKLVESDAHAASTSLGMTFGDPRYMSPEQARGDRIDRRADVYQLGCIAYEMLTGAPPFTGGRVFDVLSRQVTEAPAPLPSRRPDVPLWMEAAVARMLAKSPDDRFATTSRLVEALRVGLERGEVMEAEVARQRETIPPPSVSRVMERLGVSEPTATAPEPSPGRTLATSIVPPPASSTNPRHTAPAASARLAPAPVAVATPVAVPAPVATPAPVPLPAPVATPAPVAAPATATSPELARKRTGTPRVGVPVVVAEAVAAAPAVAAPAANPAAASINAEPDAGASQGKRAGGPSADPNVSQAWFDEAGEDGSLTRDSRLSGSLAASSTDVLADLRRRRRRTMFIGGLAAVMAAGGLALALVGGDQPSAPSGESATIASAPPAEPVVATAPLAGSAATEVPPPVPAVVPGRQDPPPERASERASERAKPERTSSASGRPERATIDAPPAKPSGTTWPTTGGDDPLLRRPTGSTAPSPSKPVIEPGPGSGAGSGSGGVSGGDGTLDPYSTGMPPDEDQVPPAVKQAEELATAGQQAMQRGELAAAASSFKKAAELDAKNLVAVAGLGELALQQGLYNDAAAHLRKAAKLAPRSVRVHTLLGEALLGLGNSGAAAEAFKRALQLDPDNARAREGYNNATGGSAADEGSAAAP